MVPSMYSRCLRQLTMPIASWKDVVRGSMYQIGGSVLSVNCQGTKIEEACLWISCNMSSEIDVAGSALAACF